MPPNLTELSGQTATIPGNPRMEPVRVPVEWFTTAFECSINSIAKAGGRRDGAGNVTGPVRLRVNRAEADSCKVEIFCEEARLCGVSAGS